MRAATAAAARRLSPWCSNRRVVRSLRIMLSMSAHDTTDRARGYMQDESQQALGGSVEQSSSGLV